MKNQNTTRYSKQRECILRVLGETDTHPTASYIYHRVREEIPNVSLGTVYRNLAKLTEEGAVIKIFSDDTSERYDACTSPHCHVLCRRCGSVSDVFIDCSDALDKEAEKVYNGKISGHSITFWGLCEKCSRSNG